MILPIVRYGDPVLRQKGIVLPAVTSEMSELIRDMMETMYDASGIGLAAHQVGHALQLAVIDVREVTDRPSTLQIDGREVEVGSHMPMVLVNPKLRPFGDPVPGPEGCLSFPELYEDVTRPPSVEVWATNEKNEPWHFTAGGLLARVVQHEVDHLNGILFIDRMNTAAKQGLKTDLDRLQNATKAELKKRKGG
jgi:peptide deformylase